MTQEIAVVPFLWMLPLALYQLSFILCFASPQHYSGLYIVGLFVSTAFYCWLLMEWSPVHIVAQLAVYAFLLFATCMVCHGEMVRLRPEPEHLTAFYLTIALGGACGGILVGVIAPLLFDYFWELPLGVAACWALLIGTVLWSDKRLQPQHQRSSPPRLLLVAMLILVCILPFNYDFSGRELDRSRNFYGVLRVSERELEGTTDTVYELEHGKTLHGRQYASASRRQEPIGYYSEESGAGLTLRYYAQRGGALRVGVIGLGIGTLAIYSQPGDTFRFYEINPAVIRLAEGKGGYFSYLADGQALVEIVPGDGRLSLERELIEGQPQRYDVLVLDAFSSDSIPVHLLTRECFEVYLAHLKADGVLAAHISNRHVDLRPVLAKLADHFDLKSVLISSEGDGQAYSSSTWTLITRNTAFLNHPQVAEHSLSVESRDDLQLWTDDYSSLFQVLYSFP